MLPLVADSVTTDECGGIICGSVKRDRKFWFDIEGPVARKCIDCVVLLCERDITGASDVVCGVVAKSRDFLEGGLSMSDFFAVGKWSIRVGNGFGTKLIGARMFASRDIFVSGAKKTDG